MHTRLARIDAHWSRAAVERALAPGARPPAAAPSMHDDPARVPRGPAAVAMHVVEDAAMRAAGYRPARADAADMVDHWRAQLGDADNQLRELRILHAAPQWRPLLGRPHTELAEAIGAERAAAARRLADFASEYGALLRLATDAPASAETDAEVLRRARALRERLPLDPGREPGSWALVDELRRHAPAAALADDTLQRRVAELHAHRDERLASECAPALAVLRRAGGALPYTVGASLCDWKLRDIGARVDALHADAGRLAMHGAYTQRIGALNADAETQLRGYWTEVFGNAGQTPAPSSGGLVALDAAALAAIKALPGASDPVRNASIAVWRVLVYSTHHGTDDAVHVAEAECVEALKVPGETTDRLLAAARGMLKALAEDRMAEVLEAAGKRFIDLQLRRRACLYVSAYAQRSGGHDNSMTLGLLQSKTSSSDGFQNRITTGLMNTKNDLVATKEFLDGLAKETAGLDVFKKIPSDIYTPHITLDVLNGLSSIDNLPIANLSVEKYVRILIFYHFKGFANRIISDMTDVINKLVTDTSCVKVDDPLNKDNTKWQHRFFRPDPHESGMLSAAINTMFCAEFDVGPDRVALPYSVPREVWAKRDQELKQQTGRGPISTGTAVDEAWYGPAVRREFLLIHWVPEDVARLAVDQALRRIAERAPSSMATLPLELIEHVLLQLIDSPAFVNWMRAYGMDPFATLGADPAPGADVTPMQRPPFRLVTPAQRMREWGRYVLPTEAYARALTNELMREPGSAPVEFIKLAHERLGVEATNAHAAWLDIVFGPAQDPYALLERPDDDARAGDSLDTLDLYHQMMALVRLQALIDDAVKALGPPSKAGAKAAQTSESRANIETVSAGTQAALAALPGGVLLRAVLYFTLCHLDSRVSREGGDLLMVLVPHADGRVAFDYFSPSVVTHIADTVYGWPIWSGTSPKLRRPQAQRPVAIDKAWLRRVAELVYCEDMGASPGVGADPEHDKWIWNRLMEWILQTRRPPKHDTPVTPVPRLMVRYPRAPLPYKGTDLRRGQAQLYMYQTIEAPAPTATSLSSAAPASPLAATVTTKAWVDIGPLAGLDTKTRGADVAWSADDASFAVDARRSVYEWRVGQRCYLRPAAVERNGIEVTSQGDPRVVGDSAKLLKRITEKSAEYGWPELLAPPFGPLTYVLEWLRATPWPSVELVYKMYEDLRNTPNEPSYTMLMETEPGGVDLATRERNEQIARLKKNFTDQLNKEFDELLEIVRDAIGDIGLITGLDKEAPLVANRFRSLEAKGNAFMLSLNNATTKVQPNDFANAQAIFAANVDGVKALRDYTVRIRRVAAPILKAALETAATIVDGYMVPRALA